MIQEFVDLFMAAKPQMEERFRASRPEDYLDIVRAVVEVCAGEGGYNRPDPERIHVIDDGNYQGTLLYVIAANTYQPSTYWYVMVSYGSCSGCDTLQAIRGWSHEPVTDDEVAGYMTLALHIVQGLKRMGVTP